MRYELRTQNASYTAKKSRRITQRLPSLTALGLASFLLSACANSLAPMNFAVPNVVPSTTKISADERSITVTIASPDEQTGPIPSGTAPVTPYWKEAVEDALNKAAIFQDDAPRKVSISVKILKLDLPAVGFAMTTNASARYEIIDRSNGSVIFTADENSTAAVPMDYAFIGLVRAQESLNRAVQNNILQFLQAIETTNVNKPM